jgi:hypothetical protein
MHSLGYSSSSFSTPISTDSLLIKTKLDSINRRNYTFVTTLINEAVMSCDKLGAETEAMYDNWYPVDSSATNIKAIRLITSELNKIPTTDSTYKNTLHILISRNIKARRLELALQDCKRMKNLYPNEGGAYFASAFIYNLQNKYPLAIIEIKKEMIIENKPDLNLIIAIIKRKAKSNDVKIK